MQEVQAALTRLIQLFETLTPQTVPLLATVYAPEARFKDPFNEIGGRAAILALFDHMYAQLREPRFVVSSRIAQGHQAFLVWELHFRFPRWPEQPRIIRGATHLRFGADGLVLLHRDYWDAAEELYEQVPLLGALMRLLKRRARR
ncbi:nuclear transport factor 2 family protein [Oxalobacteraceae bacterium]|nr:nuclear transport factor 2 family protein [Oxalobacteraceae bacterium]